LSADVRGLENNQDLSNGTPDTSQRLSPHFESDVHNCRLFTWIGLSFPIAVAPLTVPGRYMDGDGRRTS